MAESDHNTTRPPAFRFYPKDFLADENVRVMSLQERGAYITLLCTCWTEGSLPGDVTRLSRLCGAPTATMRRLWPALAVCFRPHPTIDGRVIHPRLEREREKQVAYQQDKSGAGKRGAEKRWNSRPTVLPLPEDGTPIKVPLAKYSSSSSSSSSSSDQELKSERASDSDATRAGDFVERYKLLHVRLRKGAHYIGRPTFDFQESLQLVAVYDDARLDKLAFVWLNTDHDFAQNGTRSIAKFRSMASWCEERLIEWEAQHGPLQVAS